MSNTIFLTGHIGRGDLRYTKAGKAVYSFSIADKIGYGDNEKTQWVECSLWGKRAENEKLTSMLVKGNEVTIKGTVEIEPAQGDYPAKLRVPFVEDIVQIAVKGGQPKQQAQQQPAQQQSTFEDDEIPF